MDYPPLFRSSYSVLALSTSFLMERKVFDSTVSNVDSGSEMTQLDTR